MTQTVISQLRIIRAADSLPFYVQGLGFTVDWQHQFEPGFPFFLQLTREGQTIFLTEHAGDGEVGGVVYFIVPDVDECFRLFSAGEIKPTEPPQDTPWSSREMLVTDLDGNRLRFVTHLMLPPNKTLNLTAPTIRSGAAD